MKKIFIALFFTLSLLVTAAVVTAFFQPGYYRIQRSVQIKAPVAKIFMYVQNLENRKDWFPWELTDEEIRIKETQTNQRVSIEMISHHTKNRVLSDVLFVEIPSGSIVTWGMDGRNENLTEKFFFKMKSFKLKLEQDFDQGLTQLKKATEEKLENK